MNSCNCAAIFGTDHHAEVAFRSLAQGRFETDYISLLGQAREAACGRPLLSDKTVFWRQGGMAQSGLWRWVSEMAVVWIPGVGVIAVAGPVAAVFEHLAERQAGADALADALLQIGIPVETVPHYQEALQQGCFLLVLPGSRDEVESGHALLERLDAIDLSLHLR